MKRTRCKMIALAGVVLALVTVSAAYYFLLPEDMSREDIKMQEFMETMYTRVQRMRMRLLYETNHEALLRAGRELSRRKVDGSLKRQRYNVRSDRHREAAGFPKPILDLGPNYVFIDYDGRVMVEMMGGLDHFGVYAYPEGYEKPPHANTLGDKKLIDGLWYYDDGYSVRPEDYDKRIEALRPKGK